MEKKEKKTARTTILLKQSTRDKLEELKWEKRMSVNELINQIIEDWLKKEERRKNSQR